MMETTNEIPTHVTATVANLVAPLSEEDPCGEDASYDSDFEQLKNEIDKIGEGEVADFNVVANLASELLKTKSKDVRIAVYMAVGLARTERELGLAKGLAVVHSLCEQYWEGLYPRKAARRVSVLGFLASNLSDWIERDENRKAVSDGPMVQYAADECSRLGSLLAEKLEDKAPSLARLERGLRAAIPKEKVAQTSTTAKQADTQVKPSSSTDDAAPSVGATIENEASATLALFQIASYFRDENPAHPISYKLVRAARWMPIVKAPVAENGLTKIAPPESRRITQLRTLEEAGNLSSLRTETERALQEAGFHLWIDLQHLAYRALMASGNEFRAAADAVVSETTQLVKRVPELPDLSFRDGTPFVSFETREWLDENVGQAGGAQARSMQTDDSTKEALAAATALAGEGKLEEALTLLTSAAASARKGAERFAIDLEKARLLRRSGKDELARWLLQDLDQRVIKHGIHSWDPDLAVTLWSEMVPAFSKIAGKKGPLAEAAAQTVQSVLARLTCIDIHAAIKLSK